MCTYGELKGDYHLCPTCSKNPSKDRKKNAEKRIYITDLQPLWSAYLRNEMLEVLLTCTECREQTGEPGYGYHEQLCQHHGLGKQINKWPREWLALMEK